MKIGVIGAGQLGRMLALAGYPLDLQFQFLDPSADSPGGRVGPIITGAFDDPDSLERLAADVDLVTYEFENVPVAALAAGFAIAHLPAAGRGTARIAGSAAGKTAVQAAAHSDAAVSRRRFARRPARRCRGVSACHAC